MFYPTKALDIKDLVSPQGEECFLFWANSDNNCLVASVCLYPNIAQAHNNLVLEHYNKEVGAPLSLSPKGIGVGRQQNIKSLSNSKLFRSNMFYNENSSRSALLGHISTKLVL